MNRYKFFTSGSKVVAVSSFAKKPVKGVAKCDPNDTFSLEDGKRLAAARCNEKISKKRLKRAERKLAEACAAIVAAEQQYDYMRRYYDKAVAGMDEANAELAAITSKLSTSN